MARALPCRTRALELVFHAAASPQAGRSEAEGAREGRVPARAWGHASVSGRWLRAVHLVCLSPCHARQRVVATERLRCGQRALGQPPSSLPRGQAPSAEARRQSFPPHTVEQPVHPGSVSERTFEEQHRGRRPWLCRSALMHCRRSRLPRAEAEHRRRCPVPRARTTWGAERTLRSRREVRCERERRT